MKTTLLVAASALLLVIPGCRTRPLQTRVITGAQIPPPLTVASIEGMGLVGAASPVAEKTPEVIFETGAPIRSALAAEGGRLFFGDEACNFYALDTASGEMVWRYATDAAVETQPTVIDEKVIFNAANTLYVLDASTGAQIHKIVYPADATVRVSDDRFAFNDSRTVVSRKGIAYFAALSGDIIGVGIEGGDIVDIFPATSAGEVASGIELSDNGKLLYWVDHAGTLCGLDVESGNLLFKTELEDRIFAPMLYTDGKIYLGGRTCRVYCVDAVRGDVLWSSFSADPTTWFSGGSVIIDGTLWTCTSDEHTLLALDAATGGFHRLLPTATNAYTRPVMHGENVIVAATDVYTFDRSDIIEYDTRHNYMLWRAVLTEGVLSSPVVEEEQLWVASESGRIYRFDLD